MTILDRDLRRRIIEAGPAVPVLLDGASACAVLDITERQLRRRIADGAFENFGDVLSELSECRERRPPEPGDKQPQQPKVAVEAGKVVRAALASVEITAYGVQNKPRTTQEVVLALRDATRYETLAELGGEGRGRREQTCCI